MEGLKFHNTIARDLERITQERGTKLFSVDDIEGGSFVEAMLNVLQIPQNKLSLYSDFFIKCTQYFGKHKYEISYDEAKSLFDNFKAIIDE